MLKRDPELLERLAGLAKMPFEGVAHRVVWRNRSTVQGSSGGRGRWNDPNGAFFGMTGIDLATVLARSSLQRRFPVADELSH